MKMYSTNTAMKQVGLSRATLEFQVFKILSIVKISKLLPSVSKICSPTPNLTCPDLTGLDFTHSQVALPWL